MTEATHHDLLHRFVFEQCDIRGEILSLDRSYREATEHQKLPPVAQCLLGEFLAACRLVSDLLKFDGTLTLQARGAGPIPLIMAEANADGSVRGIVKLADDHNLEQIGHTSLAQLIGAGVLSLTLDPSEGKRYQGIVALEGDSLADALTNYFEQSEQLSTRIWLFSDQQIAGGLLLQELPKQQACTEENLDAWRTAEALAQTLSGEELATLTHSEVLLRLFNEFDIRLFEPRKVTFACRCSRERCCNALTAIGREEAETLLAERDLIEMGCEFCGAQYRFTNTDLRELFSESKPSLH